jgi:aldehyde dehydrogenase (NAD+)
LALIDQSKVVIGGESDPASRYISPTVMANVQPEDKVMQEEIFGPVLPMLNVKGHEEAIKFINAR